MITNNYFNISNNINQYLGVNIGHLIELFYEINSLFFFFKCYGDHRDLHSFPTRRSSDLGTVFILNSIALLIFPPIGKSLGLTQTQFGLWSALAIHDTSSVVGAAARYGAAALVIATTVKLARALWIVPVALGTAAIKRSRAKIQIPWFILFFCLAAVINTYGPQDPHMSQGFFRLGQLGLTATLFLIGTGLSRETLARVGWRPLVQGVLLWLLVGIGSLYFIHIGWIAL